MLPVYAILYIYAFGVFFTLMLALYIFAGELAKYTTFKTLAKLPLYLFAGLTCGFIWPAMLFKDAGFREAVVECGRLTIPFGYAGTALATFQVFNIFGGQGVALIWIGFISYVILWKMLENYHQKQVPLRA